MKQKISQLEWVKIQIELYGRVSRNEALSRYITRLGALINVLKNPPYNYILSGRYEQTDYGKDYIYYAKNIQEQKREIKILPKLEGQPQRTREKLQPTLYEGI